MSAANTLRKCYDLLKQVNFADCAESPELWHRHGLLLQEVEEFLKSLPLTDAEIDAAIYPPRALLKAEDWDPATKRPRPVHAAPVLRDGEKQEPIGYISRGAIQDSLSNGLGASAYIQAGQATDEFPVAIYTHPAPSLPAVGAVPPDAAPIAITDSSAPNGIKWYVPLPEHLRDGMNLYFVPPKLIPQPAAAPSGESEITWRVAEFWSSSNPEKKVLCLATDRGEMDLWHKRSDFIRWVSHAAPSGDVERKLQHLATYGILDAEAIALIETPAVNEAFLNFYANMGLTTAIKLVDAIVKAQAAITATKELK